MAHHDDKRRSAFPPERARAAGGDPSRSGVPDATDEGAGEPVAAVAEPVAASSPTPSEAADSATEDEGVEGAADDVEGEGVEGAADDVEGEGVEGAADDGVVGCTEEGVEGCADDESDIA